MTLKNSIYGVLAVLCLLSCSIVSAAECKFESHSTDPETGVSRHATKYVGISTMMAKNFGSVQAVAVGHDKFLGMRLRAKNEFPIPPELGIDLSKSNYEYRTGRYDQRLDTILQRLRQEAAFIPKGSTLRLTLEDRSVIVLRSTDYRKTGGQGWKPQSDGNEGSNFVILSEVHALYPLDDVMINALTSRLVTGIRMETADRYYEFASRMNVQYPLTIGDKNGKQLQEVLNCVLQIKP